MTVWPGWLSDLYPNTLMPEQVRGAYSLLKRTEIDPGKLASYVAAFKNIQRRFPNDYDLHSTCLLLGIEIEGKNHVFRIPQRTRELHAAGRRRPGEPLSPWLSRVATSSVCTIAWRALFQGIITNTKNSFSEIERAEAIFGLGFLDGWPSNEAAQWET